MSRTIKAIMRHMVSPSARSGSANASVHPTRGAPPERKLKRKLRVVFARPPLAASHHAEPLGAKP
jgi:hypothetical protein